MEQQHSEREMRQLAERLLFDVQAHDGRFTLTRTVDAPAPVRHENLTLKEAVEILETWKLRGPHGG
jgi:hypothetical protein